MGWVLSTYALPLLAAAALALCTTVLLIRERPKRGAVALATTTAALGLWSLSQLVVVSTTTAGPLVAGYLATMLASLLLTAAWIVFTVRYTGRDHLLSPRTVGLALVVPVVGVLAALTNEPVGFHEVMLLGVSVDETASGAVLHFDIGIGTWVLAAYVWSLAMAGNWFLWKKFVVSRNVYRKRTLLLLVIGVVVLGSTVVSLVGVDPLPHYVLTPLVFLLLGPVIVGVLVSYRTLSFMPLETMLQPLSGQSKNLAPIARNTIIEEMDIGVLVLDHENRIVDLNPAARSFLGPDRRLVGRLLTSVVSEDLFDEPTPFLDPAVTNGHFEGIWVELESGERHCYDVTISSRGLEDRDGDPTARVVLITDVTDRERRRQRLEERTAELSRQNRQLEDFAHVVSHDLRNPVNVASGYLDLAQEEGDDGYFDQVRDAHERIETLIDDVLLMVRQGKTVEETESVELAAHAQRAWSHVETHDATLTITTDETVEADPGRLLQLLENLFRNAIDHAGESVSVELGATENGFYVEDDGPGIAAEDRETVFEKGVTGSETGTGLGLAIVSTIVEAHGWTITAVEGDSGGARFVIEVTEATDHDPITHLSQARVDD